jgi:hypothetical protein
MLTRSEDYAHQQPSLTEKKLRRLEITAAPRDAPSRTRDQKGGRERDTGARINQALQRGQSRAADSKLHTSALRYVSHPRPTHNPNRCDPPRPEGSLTPPTANTADASPLAFSLRRSPRLAVTSDPQVGSRAGDGLTHWLSVDRWSDPPDVVSPAAAEDHRRDLIGAWHQSRVRRVRRSPLRHRNRRDDANDRDRDGHTQAHAYVRRGRRVHRRRARAAHGARSSSP